MSTPPSGGGGRSASPRGSPGGSPGPSPGPTTRSRARSLASGEQQQQQKQVAQLPDRTRARSGFDLAGAQTRVVAFIHPDFLREGTLRDFIRANTPTVKSFIQFIQSRPAGEKGNYQLELLNAAYELVVGTSEAADTLIDWVEKDGSWRSASRPIPGREGLRGYFGELYALRDAMGPMRNRKAQLLRDIRQLLPTGVSQSAVLVNTCTSEAAMRNMLRLLRKKPDWGQASDMLNRVVALRLGNRRKGISITRNITTADYTRAADIAASNESVTLPSNFSKTTQALRSVGMGIDGQGFAIPLNQPPVTGRIRDQSPAPDDSRSVHTQSSSPVVVVGTAERANLEGVEFFPYSPSPATPRRESVSGPSSPISSPPASPTPTPRTPSGPSPASGDLRELRSPSVTFNPDCSSANSQCHKSVKAPLLVRLDENRNCRNTQERLDLLTLSNRNCLNRSGLQSHLCHKHLRKLTSQLGLAVTGVDNQEIHRRLITIINETRLKKDMFLEHQVKTNPRCYTWWHLSARPEVQADRLGVFRYNATAHSRYTVGRFEDLEYAARAIGSTQKHWDTFQKDGTINFGLFNWLGESGLFRVMEVELEMYFWHFRIPSGVSNSLGWLRNMYHSHTTGRSSGPLLLPPECHPPPGPQALACHEPLLHQVRYPQ